jgi:hypothetical protein
MYANMCGCFIITECAFLTTLFDAAGIPPSTASSATTFATESNLSKANAIQ